MDNRIMTLRLRREQRQMTQAELGAKLGVSQSVVSEWEKELYLPNARQLPEIAAALGCEIGELFETERR